MSELDIRIKIPDGLLTSQWTLKERGCDWSFVYSSSGREIFRGEHNGDEDHQRMIEAASMAPQMAEEIIRLAKCVNLNISLKNEAIELAEIKSKKLLERIALLELALKLPEGADPWELERAKLEGAMDKNGCQWEFVRQEDDEYKFIKGESALWVCEDGQVRASQKAGLYVYLYCIKKGSQ